MRISLTNTSQSDLRNPDLTLLTSRCVHGEPVFSRGLVAFLMRAVIHYWWSVHSAARWQREGGALCPWAKLLQAKRGNKGSGDIWVMSLGSILDDLLCAHSANVWTVDLKPFLVWEHPHRDFEGQGILGILPLVLAPQELMITCGLGVISSRMCLLEEQSVGPENRQLVGLGHKYQPSGDFSVPAGRVWWLKPRTVQAIDYIWA